jgi:hypothetical protein
MSNVIFSRSSSPQIMSGVRHPPMTVAIFRSGIPACVSEQRKWRRFCDSEIKLWMNWLSYNNCVFALRVLRPYPMMSGLKFSHLVVMGKYCEQSLFNVLEVAVRYRRGRRMQLHGCIQIRRRTQDRGFTAINVEGVGSYLLNSLSSSYHIVLQLACVQTKNYPSIHHCFTNLEYVLIASRHIHDTPAYHVALQLFVDRFLRFVRLKSQAQ